MILQKNTKTESNDDPVETVKPDSAKQTDISTPPGIAKGAYVDYTESGFASTKGTRLLFFHAAWCPQCRELDESIKSGDLPVGVTIFKVDYDTNQPLRAKYGVTLQTTVVKVDEEGNKIESYVAYEEPTLQSVEKKLLP